MANRRASVCLILTMAWTAIVPSLRAGPGSAGLPSASELLEKYAEALDATQSFIDFYESTS